MKGLGLDIVYSLEIGAVAAVAAILGSMLGLGGGVFLVPILTLFGIDPKFAVGASAVVVVTNSVVGSTNHLRIRFTNPRLAMLLQLPRQRAPSPVRSMACCRPRVIYIVFGAVLVYAAVSMVVRSERRVTRRPPAPPTLCGWERHSAIRPSRRRSATFPSMSGGEWALG